MSQAHREILKLHDFSPGYKSGQTENKLFDKLNLSLYSSELVCFMGPNGVGKSTVLRTIAGLQQPLSGTVSFPDSTEKNEIHENISVVLTDKVVVGNMTAYELITFGRYPYLGWSATLEPSDKLIIDRAIAEVNIQSLSAKMIDELSDGQRQMVMIARALVQETPVMLLDEPTAHLDLNNRVEIMNLLRKLARTTGKAILIATHELDLALQTADNIWLAGPDKKIRTGFPEDLVLNGAFDEVFQFKGYNLKTGEISYEAHLGVAVHLVGSAPEYLWTKNALQRSGFEIADHAAIQITIKNENGMQWMFGDKIFNTLQSLVDALKLPQPSSNSDKP